MRKFSGRRLQEERTAIGLRPEAVALAIDRSVYSLSGYEAGRIDPPASVVAALAEKLGVDESVFFENVDAPDAGHSA